MPFPFGLKFFFSFRWKWKKRVFPSVSCLEVCWKLNFNEVIDPAMSLFGPKWSSKRMAVRENLISKYMLVNLSFCSPRPYIFSFAAYTRQKCCSSKNTRTVEFSYKSSPAFNFEPAFFILFEAHLVGISHPSITHLRWIESLQLDVRRRLKGWKPFVYHKTILRFRINCWCRLMRNSCWYFNNNYDSPVSSFSSQCLWTRWERFCE